MKYQFWFVVGSQLLYGPEVLKEVLDHAQAITKGFNEDLAVPFEVVSKGVVTTPNEITDVMAAANADENCSGVITWMHTFSPSKMWIGGLTKLNKPYLHLNTQFNRSIPFEHIDMNFMNTNQSAHGDREHGFITSRLRMKRKVICGYWEDETFRIRLGGWMRSAVGAIFSGQLNVMRLGDNMRYVAVTEGDKIQAEKDLGWSVNTYGVGGLAQKVEAVTNDQVASKLVEYESNYTIDTDDLGSVRYQARLEIALEQMREEIGFHAYTDCFEDLYGIDQLPGLATQDMMRKGVGFGAEGDWKQAALQAVMNEMSADMGRNLSFIEDYTYHFEQDNEAVLGSHMLEISPMIAQDKPKVQVHSLGIGGKNAPARLIFSGKSGKAILVTLVDMGGRFRLIVHDIEAIENMQDMPNLPVASVMWRPQPNMITGNEAWILCGGTHHSVISYDLTAENMIDFAEIMGIECIHINVNTTIEDLRNKLALGDIVWRK
jgi:L-arabinose isomerase